MSAKGSSRILAPHRAIGIVCDGRTPFAIQSLGGEPFITVSVGHAFQVFEGNHLRVVAVSQRMPAAISALAVAGERTFVACGRQLTVWERLHPLAHLGSHPGSVVAVVLLGSSTLVSVCDRGHLKAWDLSHESLAGRKHRQRGGGGGPTPVGAAAALLADLALGEGFERPTAALHPDTYVNKVVVGSRGGGLALWNVRSGKRVHVFGCLEAAAASAGGAGGPAPAVAALEQSPALDVCAVGLSTGRVLLVNLKLDAALFSFQVGKVPTAAHPYRALA